MISSWVWHSRSAQRRPWRSLSNSSLGAGARLGERGLKPASHGGAQLALAPGMSFGQRVEVGDDRRSVDELGGAR